MAKEARCLVAGNNIDVAVVGAKIDHPVDHSRQGPDAVAGPESPHNLTARAIQRVKTAIARAHINEMLINSGRGEDSPVNVRLPD